MIPLRQYQDEDVRTLRAKKKLMVLHEAGLGKMVIASRAVYEPGVADFLPCLIASPLHVTSDWEDHLESEYPGARIQICAELSPDKKREALATTADFYVVNHTMLATAKTGVTTRNERVRNYYTMPKVRSFIVDESHYPGMGRKARSWFGAKIVADKAELVIPTTATPIRKTSDGIWSQLRLVDRTLTSYWRFVREHCIVEETPWAVEIKGSRDSMNAEIAKRSIRRTYSGEGLALPSVIPYYHRVKVADSTKAAYDRLKKDLRDEENNPVWSAGAAVAKLRVMVAKDPNMLSRLLDTVAEMDSFVIFCWYKETAHMLADGIQATLITGDVPGRTRSGIAKSATKIVATIASMGSSTDLSHHRNVIFYEECYEPGTQENALDRVKRWRKVESDEPVKVRYIYARGTISERIHNLVSARAVDSAQATERRLIREELHSAS